MPFSAFWNAKFTCCGMRFRLCTRSAYLTQTSNALTWSISWKTWRPDWLIGLDPPTATTGQQSISALARPVPKFNVAGPLAAMQTPGPWVTRE